MKAHLRAIVIIGVASTLLAGCAGTSPVHDRDAATGSDAPDRSSTAQARADTPLAQVDVTGSFESSATFEAVLCTRDDAGQVTSVTMAYSAAEHTPVFAISPEVLSYNSGDDAMAAGYGPFSGTIAFSDSGVEFDGVQAVDVSSDASGDPQSVTLSGALECTD